MSAGGTLGNSGVRALDLGLLSNLICAQRCARVSSRFIGRSFTTSCEVASAAVFPCVAAGSSSDGSDQAGPTNRYSRFFAAFSSRSWTVPHRLHAQSRILRAILSTQQPPAEHSLLEAKKRSAVFVVPPRIRVLYLERPKYFAEGRIVDDPGKVVVLHHANDVQVFEHDRLDGFGNRRGCLVEDIAANVRHAPV